MSDYDPLVMKRVLPDQPLLGLCSCFDGQAWDRFLCYEGEDLRGGRHHLLHYMAMNARSATRCQWQVFHVLRTFPTSQDAQKWDHTDSVNCEKPIMKDHPVDFLSSAHAAVGPEHEYSEYILNDAVWQSRHPENGKAPKRETEELVPFPTKCCCVFVKGTVVHKVFLTSQWRREGPCI